MTGADRRSLQENKEDPLIQVVGTHQHHTNQTLLQTVNNFKKTFQS
jgi:hypothetical protein